MWRDEKTEYLRKNRDYSRLLSGDGDSRDRDRDHDQDSGNDMEEDDGSRKRHKDYHDRRSRLKELERQKLTKGKNGFYANGDRDKDSKVHGKANGGSSSKGEVGVSSSKDKKKLPYDRSFGSFFGPSEPVVAKRIVEEARARQEAEIVASREARAREGERQKSIAAVKSSKDKKSMPKPKPVDEATLKARKLKEARDYTFLFEDTPLPRPKVDKKATSVGKPGTDVRRDSVKSALNITPARMPPLPTKSAQGARQVDRPSSSSRPLQTKAKPSQPKPSTSSRPSSGTQSVRPDVRPSDRSTLVNKQKSLSSGKPLQSKSSIRGAARPDPRREAEVRKEAALKKLVAGSSTSNGVKSSSLDRRADADTGKVERRLSSSSAQASDRRRLHSTDKRPVVSQSSHRRPESSQVLRKGGQGSTSGKAMGVEAQARRQLPASQAGKQHQSLQARPAPKPAVKPAPSGNNRAKYADDPRRDPRRDVVGRRRARSPSEESDQRPRKKVEVIKRRARSPSEESDDRPRKKYSSIGRRRDMYEDEEEDEDDSFIDDDEDQTQVSNMIRKMFRYDPSKYHGMDDDDDRAMEVGFRTIQAEERKSAREARLEDERELALIEEEERLERIRKKKKLKRKLQERG